MANEGLAKLEELLYLGSKTKTVIDSMKTETENAIASQISRVYKPSGSVSLASLPDPAESILGNVYNVSDNFTTDDKFVEGAGHKYTAGTNVAVVKVDNEYKFDVLSGAIDLSNYVEKENNKGLSANDFDNDAKAKLDSIAENATKVEASETEGKIKINGVDTAIVTIASSADAKAAIDAIFA